MGIHATRVDHPAEFFAKAKLFPPGTGVAATTTATAGDSDHIGHAHQRYNLWGNPRSASDSLLVVGSETSRLRAF